MLQASWGPAGPLQATVGVPNREVGRVPENGISMNSWVEKNYVTTKACRGLGEGRLKFLPVLGSFSRAGFAFHPGKTYNSLLSFPSVEKIFHLQPSST